MSLDRNIQTILLSDRPYTFFLELREHNRWIGSTLFLSEIADVRISLWNPAMYPFVVILSLLAFLHRVHPFVSSLKASLYTFLKVLSVLFVKHFLCVYSSTILKFLNFESFCFVSIHTLAEQYN